MNDRLDRRNAVASGKAPLARRSTEHVPGNLAVRLGIEIAPVRRSTVLKSVSQYSMNLNQGL